MKRRGMRCFHRRSCLRWLFDEMACSQDPPVDTPDEERVENKKGFKSKTHLLLCPPLQQSPPSHLDC